MIAKDVAKVELKKRTADLTGKTFGKLKVVSFSHYKDNKYPYWNCVCECGNKKVVYGYNLTSGGVTSCGCAKKGVIRKFVKDFSASDESNQSVSRVNGSGTKGVYWNEKNKKWRARIIFCGERFELGYYKQKSDAIQARMQAQALISNFLEIQQQKAIKTLSKKLDCLYKGRK